MALLSIAAVIAPLSVPLQAQDQASSAAKSAAPAATAAAPAFTPLAVDHEVIDAFPGLAFEQPLGIVAVPGDKSRVFVVEKTGRVQVITGLESGKPEKQVFLDLTQLKDGTLVTEGECGVLGLAFPPDHAQSRRCFVYYSLKINGQLHQRLARFEVAKDNPNRADAATEQPLFTQADEASNHNGGDLQFGPDGYLYVTVGDGGAGNDKFDNARFIDKGFHAAILRLDVQLNKGSLKPNPHPGIALAADGTAYYTIPADNPFVKAPTHHGRKLDPAKVRTEIWATGLRNPWRIHFDGDRLFCADVGQNLYEEVNLISPGGDYGWSHREGLHPFTQGPGGEAEPEGFQPVDPIFEYPHTAGLSITGGVVYHGSEIPKARECYVFADYATGRVMTLKSADGKTWQDATLAQEPGIAGIGLHPATGEVLFANLAKGKVQRLRVK